MKNALVKNDFLKVFVSMLIQLTLTADFCGSYKGE